MDEVLNERQGAVAVVTLNRPERLNAISSGLLDALHGALHEVQHDDAVRAVVLTGAGRAFCAGDDLKEFTDQSASAASAARHVEGIQQITRDLMFGVKPVVGAVHGYAVGGGFEWVLNCDLVVAANDLVGFFPEMGLGQFVTGGVTHLLPQTVGHQKAMELWLLGERQDAATLARLGLVNWVVPLEEMLPRAIAVAGEIATKSSFAVSRLKQMVTAGRAGDVATALELEREATMAAMSTTDAAERVAESGPVRSSATPPGGSGARRSARRRR
jgi:enoyl-CoA hydratase/carnithine racemase